MPFHGDYRMLKMHANVGIECGIPKENTFVIQNGDTLNLVNHTITKGEHIEAGEVFVDGNRVGEISSAVIRDRKAMSNDGILVVIANINMKERKLLIKPNITTRGFILVNENEELIRKIEGIATTSINKKLIDPKAGFNEIQSQITADLFPSIYELTGRKPIILPVILDIKK